jgi:LmbE family N-acetylglucosaminyl deacetylase
MSTGAGPTVVGEGPAAPAPSGGDGAAMPSPPAWVDPVGTSEDEWGPWLCALPSWSPDEVTGPVVVVAPHPDDETLGVGGLLAELLARGVPITVVAVTDGEGAFGPSTAEVRHALARRRRAEQDSALRCLAGSTDGAPASVERAVVGQSSAGWPSVVRLGLPDGAVSGVRHELAASLGPLLAGAAWCLAPLAWDGHPDHDSCGEATLEACGDRIPVSQYPIWAWHWARPPQVPPAGAVRVPLRPEARARKADALRAFRSQYETASSGPVLPPHVVDRFRRPFEVLFG